MEFMIRPEQPEDVHAIGYVTEQAFRSSPHSAQTEHFIVAALRRAGALSVSLVAVRGAELVGHIAFSPVTSTDGSAGWYGLGPVSVLPEYQGQGVGSALVERGLESLKAMGAAGCVVLGEPGFYGRFGFTSQPDCIFEGAPQEYFQVLVFTQSAAGTVTYHDAFNATG